MSPDEGKEGTYKNKEGAQQSRSSEKARQGRREKENSQTDSAKERRGKGRNIQEQGMESSKADAVRRRDKVAEKRRTVRQTLRKQEEGKEGTEKK